MNLIYQYWDGEVKESCLAGIYAMREYAERIGAEYIFEDNPHFLRKHFGYNFGNYTPHYGAFKPIYDTEFDKYDKILFADTDVFPIDQLQENIFDHFTGEIGICDEPWQPKIRTITKGQITSDQDNLWAQIIEEQFGCKVPRTEEGLVRVFNTGMVLYSKEARLKARTEFCDFKVYVDLMRKNPLVAFYSCDQPYLHAMMYACGFDVQEMDNGWNSYIHYTKDIYHEDRYMCDWRDENTKFVHVQFAGADNLGTATHWRIVNLPQEQWNLPK